MTMSFAKNHMLGRLSPIGIFDSGVGGLSVMQAIQQLLPHENLLYIADSRYAPYGERDSQWISQRVQSIAQFLVRYPCKAIVVACNTATAAAIAEIRTDYQLPVVGLEPALKPAAAISRNGKVGVLATQATLNSEKYKQLRARFLPTTSFVEIASTALVHLVEQGDLSSAVSRAIINRELQPLIQERVDTLVLGCTHFPFLLAPIGNLLGEQVTILESAQPVASELARRLKGIENQSKMAGNLEILTSADSGEIFSLLLGNQLNLARFDL